MFRLPVNDVLAGQSARLIRRSRLLLKLQDRRPETSEDTFKSNQSLKMTAFVQVFIFAHTREELLYHRKPDQVQHPSDGSLEDRLIVAADWLMNF